LLKKIITAILITAFLTQVFGCYSEYLTAKENFDTEPYDIRVVTKDKREYTGTKRLWLTKNDSLLIYDEQFIKQNEIPYNSIEEIYLKKIDAVKTTILVTSVAGTLIYVGIKLANSIKLNFQFN
jgi:hypothetical protein